jgi:DNA-binding response OmpR family regulator
MKKILIIEDDPAVCRGLQIAFEENNFETIIKNTGISGCESAKSDSPDLIILDLVLPDKNGIDICKELRAEKINTPIIMLTSKKEEIDRIIGLEIGADDYVTKPFSIRELIARVNAVFRRIERPRQKIEEFTFNNIYLNFTNQEASKGGKPVKLSTHEFSVLHYFVEHMGEIVTRDKLLDEVWGFDEFPTTRTVDNYILSIRKKIEDDPSKPQHLITIHKAGYKLVI